jgi:hypothetical protein
MNVIVAVVNRARRTNMTTFTIEAETNNIIAHTNLEDAEATPNGRYFDSEEALANLTAEWPSSQLIELWNGLPGANAVTKFKDRKTAVGRIWKAIQPPAELLAGQVTLEAEPERGRVVAPAERASDEPADNPSRAETEPNVGATVPNVASGEAEPTNETSGNKKAATGEPKAPRADSKASQVIAMLRREGGTTLGEIMDGMKWQKHTTRAILSAGGSLTKNHGLIIISEKVGDHRKYSIKG